MKVLIVGSGGREHALAWKAAQDPNVEIVLVAPGNYGTANEDKVVNVNIPADDIEALVQFAQANNIELTIVGPEAPLVAGIVDRFTEAGLKCFGPSQAAARLEGSKVYTKLFCEDHNIPTPNAYRCENIDAAFAAIRYLQYDRQTMFVVKADGLAAGKGVLVTGDPLAACNFAVEIFNGKFGPCNELLVEEYYDGPELSFIVVTDGETIKAFPTSQDYKRLGCFDEGPNTGGMGVITPALNNTAELQDKIWNEIIVPTVKGLAAEGIPYVGILYAGIILDKEGNPKLLEFNCRFGDPEAQPLMMRLNSSLPEMCLAAIDGKLDEVTLEFSVDVALGVVLAAEGYPDNPRKGDFIVGDLIAETQNTKVFCAGVTNGEMPQTADGSWAWNIKQNPMPETSGGRVLCVVGVGATLGAARLSAYDRVHKIGFAGCQFRTDIGYIG